MSVGSFPLFILRQLREFCVLHGVGGFFRRGGQELGCDHEALIAGLILTVQCAAHRERQKLIPVLDGRAVDGEEILPRHRFKILRPLLFRLKLGADVVKLRLRHKLRDDLEVHMLSQSEIITAITDRTIGKIPLNNLFDFFQ